MTTIADTIEARQGGFLYPRQHIAAARLPGRSVGIILRTRNRPLLLGRALAGILAQTHGDWHLVLVNDGDEREAVEALVNRHRDALAGRISLIHRDGTAPGIWPAAQAGLDAARQDVVALHDDDDSWEPDFLAATTGFLADPAHAGYVAVSTGCTLIEEEIDGETVRERWRCPWPHNRGLVDFRRALVDAQIPPIALAVRRDALVRAGGFETRLRYAGDWEAWLRLLLQGEIGHVDTPLANYHHRVRGSGAAYGNTVVDQTPARGEQMILLRNAMLRAGLRDRPEALGLMQALLAATAETDATPRLDALAAEIAAARVASDEAAARAVTATEAAHAAIAAGTAQATAVAEALRTEIAALRAETAAMAQRLDRQHRVGAALRAVATWLRKALRWAWRRALPLRRTVARLRGRLPAEPPPPPSPQARPRA